MKRQFRKVVKVDTAMEQHVGPNVWWQIPVHTVHLDCGHARIYRGDFHAKGRALCRECSKEG